MKQAGNSKRPRIRMNGGRMHTNRPNNSGNRVFDSQYPEGKIRGTAQQLIEKYLGLARDAASAGDRVKAEGFYQHADHYHRIVLASRPERPEPTLTDEDEDDEDFVEDGSEEMQEHHAPRPRQAPPAPSHSGPSRQEAPRQEASRPAAPRQEAPRQEAPRPAAPRPAPQEEGVYVPSPRLSSPAPRPAPRPATEPTPAPSTPAEEAPSLFESLPPAKAPVRRRRVTPKAPNDGGNASDNEGTAE